MESLEPRIDEIYKASPADFVAERTALAKTLKGADAERVKRLQKPLLVPWIVNQVYWRARPVYERLSRAGEKLRAAQVQALKGRDADVPEATRAHRQALAAAVDEGLRLAGAAGARPPSDQLARTFEALSLAVKHPETPGRLTKPLNPAGFEALGGVPLVSGLSRTKPAESVKPALSVVSGVGRTKTAASVVSGFSRTNAGSVKQTTSATTESRFAAAARERQAEADRRKQAALEQAHLAAVRKAESDVERAKSAEAIARKKWEQSKEDLTTAERALKGLQKK